MNIKALILDDDPAALGDAKAIVEQCGWGGSVVFADSPEEALGAFEADDFRVVMAGLSRSPLSGTAFLDQIRGKRPDTLRFLATELSDSRGRFKCAMGSHLTIPKPWSAAGIEAALHRAEEMNRLLGRIRMREIVSRIRTLPSLPSNYTRLLNEVRSADASSQSVGEIIAEDLAISAKLIQLVNSAYFGLQQQITDPTQAVTVLGLNTVQSLALGIKAFSRFDKVKPIYHSIDKVWRHSIEVAELAKLLVALEGGDPGMASDAYGAALLHDVGKLALAVNFDQDYRDVLNQADENGIPRDVAEREFFGCCHAELGGYLLATWGLPMPIVEAVALHHEPGRSNDEGISALAAVHIADWLVRQRKAEDANGVYRPQLDNAYLERIGLDGNIGQWRALTQGVRKPNKSPIPPGRALRVKDVVPETAHTAPAAPRDNPMVAVWGMLAAAVVTFGAIWMMAG